MCQDYAGAECDAVPGVDGVDAVSDMRSFSEKWRETSWNGHARR